MKCDKCGHDPAGDLLQTGAISEREKILGTALAVIANLSVLRATSVQVEIHRTALDAIEQAATVSTEQGIGAIPWKPGPGGTYVPDVGHEISATPLDPDRARPECPMGSKPCHNPRCAVRCDLAYENEPDGRLPNIREWFRAAPDAIVIRFVRDLTNEEIEAMPKVLMGAYVRHSA